MRKRKAKKKAKAKEEGKDYISGLPDELLHHIVSLLPTTKEAIRTCVLSKRWKLVWTHVSKIIFKRREFRTGLFEHFLSCLDKTLTLHTAPKVEKIFLQHEYSYLTGDVPCPPLDSWLLSVVGREVKDLTLELDGELNEEDGCSGGYPLPQFLYQNSSLVKLSTTFCCFTPKGSVSWESLKHLSISLAALTDRVLENILQGTPLLHSLELSRCYGICRIDLSHNTRLKMLVMYDLAVAPYKLNSLIKISCPYLEDLEILGTWWGMNLEFINISPFASVSLDFEVEIATSDYDCQRSVMKLLQNVSHTKKLKLGNWCVQVLSSWRQSVLPFLSSTRKYLVLDISRFDLKWMCGIQHLLLSSHKLEKLVINFGHDHCKYWSDASTPICSWSPYGEFFTCLEFHLKTVEITGFNKSVCSHEYGYDFFRFLFAKSRVLERVIIFDLIEERDLMFQVAKELLSFPRASRSAVVLLQD